MNNTHVVSATHHYYGPSKSTRLLVQGSLEQCKQYVVDHRACTYVCRSNETGRPDLRIRKISSLSKSSKSDLRQVPSCTAQE